MIRQRKYVLYLNIHIYFKTFMCIKLFIVYKGILFFCQYSTLVFREQFPVKSSFYKHFAGID